MDSSPVRWKMKASKPPKMLASLRELYLNNTANHVMDFSQSRPIRDARWLSDRRDSFTFGLIFSSWIRFLTACPWFSSFIFPAHMRNPTWPPTLIRYLTVAPFYPACPCAVFIRLVKEISFISFLSKALCVFFLIFRPSNQNKKKKTTQRRLSSALRNERGVN